MDILDGMIVQIDNHLEQVKATYEMLEQQNRAIFAQHDMVAESVLQILRAQIVLAGQVSFLATIVQLMRDGCHIAASSR